MRRSQCQVKRGKRIPDVTVHCTVVSFAWGGRLVMAVLLSSLVFDIVNLITSDLVTSAGLSLVTKSISCAMDKLMLWCR